MSCYVSFYIKGDEEKGVPSVNILSISYASENDFHKSFSDYLPYDQEVVVTAEMVDRAREDLKEHYEQEKKWLATDIEYRNQLIKAGTVESLDRAEELIGGIVEREKEIERYKFNFGRLDVLGSIISNNSDWNNETKQYNSRNILMLIIG